MESIQVKTGRPGVPQRNLWETRRVATATMGAMSISGIPSPASLAQLLRRSEEQTGATGAATQREVGIALNLFIGAADSHSSAEPAKLEQSAATAS
jgi:hypothetical protein